MPGHAPNNSSPSSASLTLAAALLDLGLRRGLAAAFLAAALLDLGLAAAFLAALERFFRVLLFWDMFWCSTVDQILQPNLGRQTDSLLEKWGPRPLWMVFGVPATFDEVY